MSIVGFHGKLPCTGDFVHRRLPPDFIGPWDYWLQTCIEHARRSLGDRWLQTYLHAPPWRFALSPGVCGGTGWTGVLLPSLDRVGRHFPLALLAPLPPNVSMLQPMLGAQDWFDELILLAQDAVEGAVASVEELEVRIAELGTPPNPPAGAPPRAAQGVELRALPDAGSYPPELAAFATMAVEREAGPCSVWWHSPGDIYGAWCLAVDLPDQERFRRLLQAPGRPAAQLRSEPRPAAAAPAAEPAPALLSVSFAGVSHPGKTRKSNQDAFLLRGDTGLFVVADGVGGGHDGGRASRAVCEILELIPAETRIEALCDAARQALHTVHGELREDGAQAGDTCATTVVALVVLDGRYGVMWAGDSRLYRLRGDTLHTLTRDHRASVEADALGAFGDLVGVRNNVITSAIGGPEELRLEEDYGEVQPGDRFLLCSDGVHGEISDAELADLVAHAETPEACCAAVQDEVLTRAARDNLTVVTAWVD